MATGAIAHPAERKHYSGLIEWLLTTDHKKIGIMYIIFNLTFFMIGGLMAVVMRMQLAEPEGSVLDQNTYNQIFTMHGTTMLFFFIIPIGAGFANYLVPLMIGAKDMAFPRINALSLWLIPLGGFVLFSSFFAAEEAPAAGWTGYPPLSTDTFLPSRGMDLWIISLVILGLSSTMGSINFLATMLTMRAPGMTFSRMPLFCWMTAVNSTLIIFAVPVFTAALALLFADRNLGTHFFDPRQGGNPLLYQHLFWFYSHPAVYIMILPAMGIISEVLPVFSRKPLFGRRAVIIAGVLIGVYGFTVWMHHMFTTGLNIPLTAWTMAMTMAIAIPTGVKMFNWLGTLWLGSIDFKPPLIFGLGFLFLFLIGGIDGVYSAVVPVDYAINDTYWVVSHIHYVLFGGAVFGVFAGIFFWFPKMTGKMLNEGLARLQFWLMFIGMNLAFMPMHVLGLEGMPRRIADYRADAGWGDWNMVSSVGAVVVALGILVFLVNVARTLIAEPRAAGDDPWEGNTLEWMTSSPPPEHNFDELPTIESDRPAFDRRMRVHALVVPEEGTA